MMADKLPIYLSSPARKPPSQEFDYKELLEDQMFHAMIEKERRKGFFDDVVEGTAEFNSKLKQVALAFVRAANEDRAALFRDRGVMYGREYQAYREAISCYNRALEISHASPSRHLTLADRASAYMNSQNYAGALADAQEAARLAPNYAIAHSLAGYCQSQLGQVSEAIVNYRRALHINPRDECSQSLLEDAEMELIKSGESAEDIEALKLRPVGHCPTYERLLSKASSLEGLSSPSMTALSFKIEDSAQEKLLEPCADLSRATHQRYFNSEDQASNIQEMTRKASLHNKSELEDLVASVSIVRHAGEETARRVKLPSRKVNPFGSIVKLPQKLKTALAKKSWRRSDPEPLRVSGDRRGLNDDAAEGADESSNPYPLAMRDRERSTDSPPKPSRREPETTSNKAPAGSESMTNVRDPAEATAPAPAASALGASVSDSPVIRGHDANHFSFSSYALKERETCELILPAGDPVIMRDNTHFDGGPGGVAVSPDTVRYNEYELRRLASPRTPLLKTPPRQCPGRPPRPSEAMGDRPHARRKSNTAPVQPEPDHAIYVPPSSEERMAPPCPFNTRLVPAYAPAKVLPTSTQQPSLAAGSQWLTAEHFSDKDQLVVSDPPCVHGVRSDFCILKDERVGELGVNKDEKLGW